MEDWTPFIVVWGVMGVIGAMIGSSKKMGAAGGFFLGVLLGPIGVLVAAVSSGPSTLERIEAKPEEPGWHPDPLGRFDARWYDGKRWTQHVGRVDGDQRVQLEDPL